MADNAEEQTFVQLFVEHPGAVRLGSWMGMALALMSLGLLLWAEQYAIATASGLEEGAGKVVAIQPDRVDPANEGKLGQVTGEATTKDQ